jgi:rhodanese-related sulfurtransferase
MMAELSLATPTHPTEVLRSNMCGDKTVSHMLAEAAAGMPFNAMKKLNRRLASRPNGLMVIAVREEAAFNDGHIPSAHHLRRGQLELRLDQEIPDPILRNVTCGELGKISTQAADTLRQLGFIRTRVLDGGIQAWGEAGSAVEA